MYIYIYIYLSLSIYIYIYLYTYICTYIYNYFYQRSLSHGVRRMLSPRRSRITLTSFTVNFQTKNLLIWSLGITNS